MDYSEEDLQLFISQCEKGINHLTEQLSFYQGKQDELL
jgi:hypothetical protein